MSPVVRAKKCKIKLNEGVQIWCCSWKWCFTDRLAFGSSMSGVNVLRDKKGSLSKKDSRLINSPKEEENDRWPSCNLFVLIPAYKKSKLNERKILVVRSLFYSSLEFCTMIERWHVTEISTSDFTHHSVHSSCVHSLDHAGKDTLMHGIAWNRARRL